MHSNFRHELIFEPKKHNPPSDVWNDINDLKDGLWDSVFEWEMDETLEEDYPYLTEFLLSYGVVKCLILL